MILILIYLKGIDMMFEAKLLLEVENDINCLILIPFFKSKILLMTMKPILIQMIYKN